jgi:very-short-patch-repair endonuclease
VTRQQLLAAGVSSREIAHRVAIGALHPVYRGVYAVGHAALTEHGRMMAAVLASGPGAALSFFSAAVLWDLLSAGDNEAMHVSRAGPRRDGRPGIVVHETKALDTTRRHGIPVTTPARTILDLAGMAGQRDLERALNAARTRRLVGEAVLLERAAGRPGAERLRDLLDHEPSLTRSEAERRLLELIDRAGLPRPRTNARVEGLEVDALWPDRRLVVEVDGFAFHRHRDAFERDRARDARLTAAGYRTVRLTWRRLTCEPLACAATLAQALQTADRVTAAKDPPPALDEQPAAR